jgi:hypothetical protein
MGAPSIETMFGMHAPSLLRRRERGVARRDMHEVITAVTARSERGEGTVADEPLVFSRRAGEVAQPWSSG